jgi:hypothetical protein
MKTFIRGDCGGVGSDSPSMVTKEERKNKGTSERKLS